MDQRPVGLLDSGLGGISVLGEALRQLPNEDYVYYGDTANAPYGDKTPEEVLGLVHQAVERLIELRCKAIVIACNTATSVSAGKLRQELALPIIGMEPALKPASLLPGDGKILVMATRVTLALPKFQALMAQYGRDAVPVPCPGLMECVERGELEGPQVTALLRQLLGPWLSQPVKAVVLGCTHYPFLRKAIAALFPKETPLIDGNAGSVRQLRRRLEEQNLLSDRQEPGRITFLSSSEESIGFTAHADDAGALRKRKRICPRGRKRGTFMKKVMLIFGTRPEAIKMCPLVLEMRKHPELETVVCVTGQHRQMLDQILECFHVEPKYDLSIMQKNQTLFDVTVNILIRVKEVLENEKPDVVLVHGDTSTAFVTALACFYLQIPVGHVEAGLRTYNLYSPFPEEFNRQAVDLISQYYFAPTETSRQNLLKEGKPDEKIFVTGNTVIDALATTVRHDYQHPEIEWAKGSRLLLLTAHRRENLGEPMREMFTAIRRIVDEFPDVKVIYPMHLNPVVREMARACFAGEERVHLIEPLDVLDFHNLMAHSYLILTDSGGIQEEAPALGKPVLVMRDTTERPEGVAAGTLRLVGTDEQQIYAAVRELLTDPAAYHQMEHAVNPYGDGKASQYICDILSRG